MPETIHMQLVPRSFDGCHVVLATDQGNMDMAHLSVILRSEFTLKTCWFGCDSSVQFDQNIVEYDD